MSGNGVRMFILGSAGLGVIAVGTTYVVAPELFLGIYGIQLQSTSEANIVRSACGGLFLAFGCIFLIGAIQPRHQHLALAAMLAFMGGLATGRVVSVVTDGWPHAMLTAVLAVEIVYACAAALILKSQVKATL